jgi:hypothetical protein
MGGTPICFRQPDAFGNMIGQMRCFRFDRPAVGPGGR